MLEIVRSPAYRAERAVLAKPGMGPHFMGSPDSTSWSEKAQKMRGKVTGGRVEDRE